MPVLSFLNPLDKNTLLRILTEPRNALIKQYKKLFEMDGAKLLIEDDVLEFIVDKSIEYKLGARGLRSICESIMVDAMFDVPEKNKNENVVNITLDYAREQFESKNTGNLKVA
jgi:ATP-dependent Clp protease ATP-binding subunit ClpX